MKKIIPSLVLILLCSTVMLFYACDKKELKSSSGAFDNSRIIRAQVTSWLDRQQAQLGPKYSENMEILKSNLELEKAHVESLYDSKKLLVIPIRKGLADKKQIDPNRLYHLALVLDRSQQIESGKVVIFKADNASPEAALPENTLSKLYKSEPVSVAGQFRFLHIAGNLLYLMDVKNGRPYSYGRYKTKNRNASAGLSQVNAQCTNYYLVLTYYENGVAVKETWTYIGQVCESEGCGNDYETFCPPGGGGNGGGETGVECCIPDPYARVSVNQTPSDYLMYCGLESIDPMTGNPIKTCDFLWDFVTNNILWYNWKYTSNEVAVFEKVSGTWKFKSFRHKGENKTGSPPVCITETLKLNPPETSIDATRLTARVFLSGTMSISYCTPLSTPAYNSIAIGRNFTHRG